MSRSIEEVMAGARRMRELDMIDDAELAEFEALEEKAKQDELAWQPERIQSLRTRNKLSLADFAELLNVSSSTARRWESGSKKPAGTARKLLQILDTHGIDALICR